MCDEAAVAEIVIMKQQEEGRALTDDNALYNSTTEDGHRQTSKTSTTI